MESSEPFDIEFKAVCTIKIKKQNDQMSTHSSNQVFVYPELTKEQRELILKYDTYSKLCVTPPEFEIRDLSEEEVRKYLTDLPGEVLKLEDAMIILEMYKKMAEIAPELSKCRKVSDQLTLIKEPRIWAKLIKQIGAEVPQWYKDKYNLDV